MTAGTPPTEQIVFTIYALTDPSSSAVCYVGQTRNSPEYRLWCHMRDKYCSQSKREWMVGMIEHGLKPGLVVLQVVVCCAYGASECEARWIDIFRRAGAPLFNDLSRRPAVVTSGISKRPCTACARRIENAA